MPKEASYYADVWYPRVKAARAAREPEGPGAAGSAAEEPGTQAEASLESQVERVQQRAEQSGIEGFSTVAAYLNEGPEALREWLRRQDPKDIKTIMRHNALYPGSAAPRTKDVDKLVDIAMEMTELRAHAGDGFRYFNY